MKSFFFKEINVISWNLILKNIFYKLRKYKKIIKWFYLIRMLFCYNSGINLSFIERVREKWGSLEFILVKLGIEELLVSMVF